MSNAAQYSQEELAEFNRLTLLESSRNQLDRISARLKLRKFVAEHGEEKCNAMFEVLRARDSKRKRRNKE